jgi:hypothetical protein
VGADVEFAVISVAGFDELGVVEVDAAPFELGANVVFEQALRVKAVTATRQKLRIEWNQKSVT